ncbi:MAG: hypothetical protein CME06_17945 [Gemmatimonadetes bacterium]|nr:hypothetical protein [Gemmatimonadota bacterium]
MYRRRGAIVALFLSLLFHAAVILAPLSELTAASKPAEEVAPIELVFEREERGPRMLAPEQPESAATREREPTPYFSEKNTRAQDRTPGGEDRVGPHSAGETPIPELYAGAKEPTPRSRAAESAASPRDLAASETAREESREPGDLPADAPGPRYLRPPTESSSAASPRGSGLTLAAEDANAAGEGDLSLSTYAWRWVPYMRSLKARIEKNLHPPPAFARLGIIEGETRLRFRIYPDGRLDGPVLLRSSSHPSLDEASMHSVRASAPMAPLPDDFPEDRLDVVFTYYYRVPNWARRRGSE